MTLAAIILIMLPFFSHNHFIRVDGNHRSFFYLWASNRWLCLRTDIISACVVFVSGCAILLGNVEAGWAGLTLSYSLEFTECLLVKKYIIFCHFAHSNHPLSLFNNGSGSFVLTPKWK
jgi:hypothetical protein